MKQLLVREYLAKHVPTEHRSEFISLMVEWDGSRTVLDAFYDIDVLHMKNKEASEITP